MKIEQISLMHSRIHASISYSFKKKIITFHASSNHSSYSTKSLKIIYKKREKVRNDIFCLSLKNVRHSLGVCRQFKSKIQVLLLYISRPSARQWSLISFSSHQDPMRCNGNWSLYIEALYEAMVIDLFTLRPSAKQWSLISYVTSRTSARQWSSISLHQDPLRGNGHWSLYIKTLCEAMVIDFLCHTEALCEAMVIDLFTSRPSAR